MDYNEYDGNGNKRRFNLMDIMNDRQQRSRFFLVVYLVIFVLIVIFVRLNVKNSLNEENKNNNEEIVDNTENTIEEIIESDDSFSFIEMNNYDFIYTINIKNTNTIIEGKRFNDKFSFQLSSSGEVLYFNGTSNYIKARQTLDGEYKMTGFPYVLVNIFDTNIIKKIVNNSTLNNDKYEITTGKIGELVNNNNLSNNDAINTIELIKNNNKITEINLDLSNAISSYMKDTVSAKINMKYSNFGLIDDFKIE